jgi:dienelactone hydrolase
MSMPRDRVLTTVTIPRTSARAIVAVTLSAAACLACGKDAVEPNSDSHDGPQLSIFADSVAVDIFTTAQVSAAVFKTADAPQWASRDQNIATVNASGAIIGVGVGSTYVVAALSKYPDARDSVRVRVYSDSCGGARPDLGGAATAEDRKLFSYDVNAPLNLEKTVESTSNGVEVSAIAFDSPDGGRVTGLLFDPVTRSSLRPGMVLMHGLPGTARDIAGMAQTYAQYGAVVIAIDAPLSRRTPAGLMVFPEDRAEQIQLIKDLQRAVDVLISRPNVDQTRIGYAGFSYGGAMGVLFVGIERRLKAAALVVADPGLVTHNTGPQGFKYISGLPCARRAAWIRAMAPIEPIRFIGNANVPLLFQNGTLDEAVPESDAAELHAAAPEPKEIRWYQAGHGLNQQDKVDRLKWFQEKIGLDTTAGGAS